MGLRLEEVVVDTRDHVALGSWWQEALGWPVVGQDEGSTELRDAAGPSIIFVQVPEAKSGKNRLHLDWIPDDQEADVARLIALGATRVSLSDEEQSWVVLADPEGNEFCVLSARD